MAGLMMNSVFGHGKPGTFEERLRDQIREIQESRRQKFGTGLYLICLTDGSIDKFEPIHEKETDDFIICFNGVSKDSIDLVSQHHILAVLSALMLSADSILAYV
ncbi:MAG: hypothetical protein AAF810_21920 [Cyanobacteria bacterium P01_D01_bin.36]